VSNQDILFKVIEILGTGLSTLSFWLITRLIKRIDHVDSVVSKTMPVQAEQIRQLQLEFSRISQEFRDVTKLREEVAVIKFALQHLRILKDEQDS